jgi:putative DNA primase/helicase
VNAPLSLPELRPTCTPLDAALAYLAAGFRIVGLHHVTADGACTCQEGARCRRPGKHPRADFYKRAGLDWKAGLTKAQATELWKRFPLANLGLSTGGARRLVALDIDGEDGRAQLAAFEKAHGALPTTATACTGSGGEHRLFICPAHLDLSALSNRVGVQGRGAGGLDVRVDGGQIVAAPSLHPSGRRYEWTHRGPIAELPEALYRLLTAGGQEDSQGGAGPQTAPTPTAPPAEPPRSSNSRPVNRPEAFERARMWLAAQPPAIEAQGGSKTLFRVAVGLVRGFGLSDDQALQLIWSEYNPRCQPPWDREAKDGPVHKVRDARQRGQMPFGQLLEQEGTWRAPPKHDSQGPRATVETVEEGPSNEPAAGVRAWPKLDDLFDGLGDRGPRVPTGLSALDKAWRGGLLMGKRVGILGAPGAGKTTLAVQLAVHFAKQKIPVVYVANDEPRDDLLIRLGQLHGYAREMLERGGEDTKRRAAAELAGLPFWILDPDEGDLGDGADVLAVVEQLRDEFPQGPAVVVLDSLQTLAGMVPDSTAEGVRAKVDHLLGQCKVAARKHGVLVLFLSEMNRSAYRFRGESQVEDIAAGKESGQIEYGADVLLVMRNLPRAEGEQGPALVEVKCPKSRLGKVEPFGLELRGEYSMFREAPLPAKPAQGGPGSGSEPPNFEELVESVFGCIEKRPGVGGAQPIAHLLKRREGAVRAAVRELEARGRVEVRGRPPRHGLWVASAPPQEAGEDADQNGIVGTQTIKPAEAGPSRPKPAGPAWGEAPA